MFGMAEQANRHRSQSSCYHVSRALPPDTFPTFCVCLQVENRSRFSNPHGDELGVRQCQRLFRQLGFRLRKPRPEVACADPELKRTHKETPKSGR
jgi:hypothetical protein